MKKVKKGKRILALLVAMCMVFTLAPAIAFADDSVALTVKAGSEVKKSYTKGDLESIAQADFGENLEENRLIYSGFNSANSPVKQEGAWGPKVISLLADAGIDTAALSDNSLISFAASDGYLTELTWKQIKDTAYYYPKAEKAKDGEKAAEESLEGRKEVWAIIDLNSTDKKGDTQLSIGQQSPNDVNWPKFNKGMATGGTITVETKPADKLQPVQASVAAGVIDPGTTIELDAADGWIYYTTDGAAPTKMDYLYTYYNNKGIVKSRTITAPQTAGTFTIKAYATNYGNVDSDVKTFTYRVATSRVSSVKLNKKSISLAPKAVTQLKTTVSPANASVKDVTWTSANRKVAKVDAKGKVTAVAQGKTTVTATTLDGNKKASCTVYVGPKKVGIKKAKSTKRGTITATWKRNSKASGYQVVAATNKAFSKNKKTVTVKKNKITKATVKKLKKGKKYYVKVRAYKKMDGKKIYGAYSNVKKVKVKK